MPKQLKLGDLAKDGITGFTGIVVCRSEWLNGCVRLTLQPKALKDGRPVEQETFDIEQLQSAHGSAFKPRCVPSGGPKPTPARHPAPKRERRERSRP